MHCGERTHKRTINKKIERKKTSLGGYNIKPETVTRGGKHSAQRRSQFTHAMAVGECVGSSGKFRQSDSIVYRFSFVG